MWRVWLCRWGSSATWRVGTGRPAREYHCVFMSWWHPRKHAQTLPDLRNFRLVQFLKYLGSLMTENSDNNTDIKARIMAGNRSYYSVLPLLRSKAVSKTTKIRMYKTVIRPEVLYGSEAWCLTANDEKNLRIWERKVLRKILCGLEEQNKWRSEAVIWRIGHSNGNKKRKIEMAATCGEDEWGKGGKKVISEHSRSVGRPRLRWMEDVREDLRRMGVTNWRIRAHRRDDWKMVVKEAKVLQGLYSHGVVVASIWIGIWKSPLLNCWIIWENLTHIYKEILEQCCIILPC